MAKNDLTKRFEALFAEHGPDWKKIAETLNQEEIRPPKGGKWDNGKARSFYNRAFPQKWGRSSQTITHKQKPKLLPKTPELPQWLDSQSWEEFRHMLEWWRTRRDEAMYATRPIFKVSTDPKSEFFRRNTGVHLMDEILKRAMKKAKEDRVRSGGSLSQLVEVLLWEYIGRPDDLVEKASPVCHLP